jgi:hypothetical protein
MLQSALDSHPDLETGSENLSAGTEKVPDNQTLH